MFPVVAWWSSRSSIAPAITVSPKTSPHAPNKLAAKRDALVPSATHLGIAGFVARSDTRKSSASGRRVLQCKSWPGGHRPSQRHVRFSMLSRLSDSQ